MPTYDWICHSCQTSNAADAERCSKCNCPAVATGIEISSYSDRFPSKQKYEPRSSEKSEMATIWFFIGGIWLLGGAIYQVARHEWFPLFPIQIDGVFGFFSAIFGANSGLYVSSFFAGFLGVGCLWLGIAALTRNG